MTYAVGSTILAADINSWLSTMNAVYGVGNGDRGYGQTSLQAAVSAGNTINSAHWTNLRTMLVNSINHLGAANNIVPAANLATGQTIYAEVSGTAPHNYDIGNAVTYVDSNRYAAGASDMILTSGALVSTKAAAWSAATSCTIDVIYASEDHARFFFNTGGQVRIRLTATSTLLSSGASQDVDWRDVITNKVGTITLSAHGTSRSGTAGTVQGAGGFYGITGTSGLIYDGTNIGGTGYTTNDVQVSAQVLNVAGVNGGNGTTIRFIITARDDHTNVNYDSVSAGLTVNFDHYKVGTTNLPGAIAAPTFGIVSAWS